MNRIEAIHNFWFEGVTDETPIDLKAPPFKKWFIVNRELDAEIRNSFEADLNTAAEGGYKDWEQTPRGRLALIILFDQFSRNMYRNNGRMYAYDAMALELALRTMEQGIDRGMMLIERAFLYLPLMHFEDPGLQQRSVACFKGLLEEAKQKHPANAHYYEYSLKHAIEHHDTVAQHGRFPHRDVILNREY